MEANESPSEPPGKKMNFLPLQLVSAPCAAPNMASASTPQSTFPSSNRFMLTSFGRVNRSARRAAKNLGAPAADRQPDAIQPARMRRGGKLRRRHLLARGGNVQLVARRAAERDARRVRHP